MLVSVSTLNLKLKSITKRVLVAVANLVAASPKCAETSLLMESVLRVITVALDMVLMTLALTTKKNKKPLLPSPVLRRREGLENAMTSVITVHVSVVMSVVSNMVKMTTDSLLNPTSQRTHPVPAVAVAAVAEGRELLVTLTRKSMKNAPTTKLVAAASVTPAVVFTLVT